MRKILLNIVVFFKSLAWGMRGADKVISSSNKDTDGADVGGIEQQKHQDSVYADLLRGEVTQEVKEVRYEMYEAERKSKEYEYGGNGRAVKKSMFDDDDMFSGVENSDNLDVVLIQENKEELGTLKDNGIYAYGERVSLADNAKYDLRTKDKKEHTISIKRDFFPSFRIEDYTEKIVVKKCDENTAVLDFYIPSYRKQFDNNSKLFIRKLEQIRSGETRSDIVDLPNVEFITFNAVGVHDLIHFEFDGLSFQKILDFDGFYIVRFRSHIVDSGTDLTKEFYDEATAKKIENNEMRKGATLDISGIVEAETEAEYDVDTAIELSKELNND